MTAITIDHVGLAMLFLIALAVIAEIVWTFSERGR